MRAPLLVLHLTTGTQHEVLRFVTSLSKVLDKLHLVRGRERALKTVKTQTDVIKLDERV